MLFYFLFKLKKKVSPCPGVRIMVTDARRHPIEVAPPADRVGHRAQSFQWRNMESRNGRLSAQCPSLAVVSQLSRWFMSIWKGCSRFEPSHREPPGLLFCSCPSGPGRLFIRLFMIANVCLFFKTENKETLLGNGWVRRVSCQLKKKARETGR